MTIQMEKRERDQVEKMEKRESDQVEKMEKMISSSSEDHSESCTSKSAATASKSWSIKRVISKELWPRKLSSVFGRRKRVSFRLNIIDNVVYRILSVAEVVVLVSRLCFFFVCCGCHF